VTLNPGESVGEHTTGSREESVIILEGAAEIVIAAATAFGAVEKHFVYIPPDTVHDIRNAGTGMLRYVYIVAPV
jgi:mannose-6-phosphate isomerase-like protein (cupin superfamily)